MVLFGAKYVIRNLWRKNHNYPQKYTAQKILETLGLNRGDLVNLAQMLGCDYTEGVSGIGTVKALQIAKTWPNLREFKKWHSDKENREYPEIVNFAKTEF